MDLKYDNDFKLSQFWIVNGRFIGEKYSCEECVQLGDYILIPDCKWDTKISLMDEFKNKSYSYYPRGRTRLNLNTMNVEILCDRKIFNDKNIKLLILRELNLDFNTIFTIDNNYESFVDIY